MKWENEITSLLGLEYPILQAPMLVVSTPGMVASAANMGCLGVLPLGYADRQTTIERVQAVKSLTSKPFAVNVLAYEKPQLTHHFNTDTLRSFYKAYDIPLPAPVPESDPYFSFEDLMDIIIGEGIKAVTFHFGLPKTDIIDLLHKNGIIVLATATCVEEAILIEQNGLDIVIAQGIEAGGNRGTFLKGPPPEIGLFSLLPQIIDAVSIPVIAAGGIAQGRSIAAAFMLGAKGVMLGSLFLRSRESGAPVSWKEAVANVSDRSTVLTTSWSGRYGRCIPNRFTRAMTEAQIFPSPIQHYMTTPLRQFGRLNNIFDLQSLWAGQSAAYAKERSVQHILNTIINETAEVYDKIKADHY